MKINTLIKTLLLFCGMSCCMFSNAQEAQGKTYAVISQGSATDLQPYITALNNSDMKYHRLKNTRNIIEFNTGVKVELFSATEINATGHSLTLSDYPENFPANRDLPGFSLGPNNFIMEEHKVSGKHY